MCRWWAAWTLTRVVTVPRCVCRGPGRKSSRTWPPWSESSSSSSTNPRATSPHASSSTETACPRDSSDRSDFPLLVFFSFFFFSLFHKLYLLFTFQQPLYVLMRQIIEIKVYPKQIVKCVQVSFLKKRFAEIGGVYSLL